MMSICNVDCAYARVDLFGPRLACGAVLGLCPCDMPFPLHLSSRGPFTWDLFFPTEPPAPLSPLSLAHPLTPSLIALYYHGVFTVRIVAAAVDIAVSPSLLPPCPSIITLHVATVYSWSSPHPCPSFHYVLLPSLLFVLTLL